MASAIVLLSGGLDSSTTLAIAASEFQIHAISFRYGQRHGAEIDAACRIGNAFNVVQHEIIDLDLRSLGKSALTDDLEVPKDRSAEEMQAGIPITYVPARNTVFLAFALAWAEVIEAFDIFIGVNAMDYAGYPDCRPEYIASFQAMANLATKAAVESSDTYRIHTPVIEMTKKDIIRTGLDLGVDFSLTSSCYDPSPEGAACGSCDACLLRLQGFAENNSVDPIEYQ